MSHYTLVYTSPDWYNLLLLHNAINATSAIVGCLSVTFVYSVETNKRIFRIFTPPDNQTILVF